MSPVNTRIHFESESSRCRRRLAAMIGLQRPASNQSLCAPVARFRQEKFQFPSLVAAERKSGLVVAFDQQTWPAQSLRKTRECFNGRW